MISRSAVSPQEPGAKLAVITVCRNALADLKMTTESVQRQTAPGIAHVVVDGASTDGTREWFQAHPTFFAVALSEPDNGIYDAMNKALDLSPPVDWILFLNAGDRFHDDRVVASFTEDLGRKDVDFIFGAVEICDAIAPGRTKLYSPRETSTYEMPGCHQSCFARASVIRKLKFDPSYRVGGDFELWLRATQTHNCKTLVVDRVIATIAPEGFSSRNEGTLQRDYVAAINKHLNRFHAVAWLAKRRVRRMALAARSLRGL